VSFLDCGDSSPLWRGRYVLLDNDAGRDGRVMSRHCDPTPKSRDSMHRRFSEGRLCLTKAAMNRRTPKRPPSGWMSFHMGVDFNSFKRHNAQSVFAPVLACRELGER